MWQASAEHVTRERVVVFMLSVIHSSDSQQDQAAHKQKL